MSEKTAGDQGLAAWRLLFSAQNAPPSPSRARARIRPPGAELGTLRRVRLEESVSFFDASHRTTVVSAPAGYGKTTLLADWSRRSGVVCAWLSLDPTIANPENLHHWIVLALQRAAPQLQEPIRGALLGLDPNVGRDPPEDCRGVVPVLELLSEPLALIIDDLHLAGPALDEGLLGALVASGPPGLHLILSARGEPAISLAASRLRGEVTDVRAGDLAFTPEETGDLLSMHGFDGRLEGPGLWGMTGGWPVALAEGLILRATGAAPAGAFSPEPRRAFLDYIVEDVLAPCPAPLSDFVLRATTRNTIDRRLAMELSGDGDGALLLEHCLREGFFLSEDVGGSADGTCSWQPLFAAACRTLVAHRAPRLARSLHGAVARHYRDVDVPTCVAEAVLGGEPRTAMTSIAEHWLEMVVAGSAAPLERLCLGLPFPWSEDPEILLVRSACRALAGDHPASFTLGRRAVAGSSGLGAARRRRFGINRELFERYVLGLGDPAAAARRGSALIDLATEHPSAMLADGLFLLGRAENRSARPGDTAADLLRMAASAGAANGITAVEISAGAELALAHAVRGDFAAAEECSAAVLGRAETCAWPRRESLAPVWLARGIVAYWQGDVQRAGRALAQAVELGCDPFPGDSLTMIYRILIDCATGDHTRLATSARALEAFDAQGSHDSSWPILARVSAAKLREAVGDVDGAVVVVRGLARGGISPLADVLVAELLRKAGEPEKALTSVGALKDGANPPFLEVSGALTEALIADSAGKSAVAHERLEHAAHCADPGAVLLPFMERRRDLLPLLVQHAAWGTAHDAFIASALAHRPPEPVRRRQPTSWTLSERELEVLAHLRTLLTVSEIAASLFVSVNTLKSHQQSIYRKLGAPNRRSAVRIAMERGLL